MTGSHGNFQDEFQSLVDWQPTPEGTTEIAMHELAIAVSNLELLFSLKRDGVQLLRIHHNDLQKLRDRITKIVDKLQKDE